MSGPLSMGGLVLTPSRIYWSGRAKEMGAMHQMSFNERREPVNRTNGGTRHPQPWRTDRTFDHYHSLSYIAYLRACRFRMSSLCPKNVPRHVSTAFPSQLRLQRLQINRTLSQYISIESSELINHRSGTSTINIEAKQNRHELHGWSISQCACLTLEEIAVHLTRTRPSQSHSHLRLSVLLLRLLSLRCRRCCRDRVKHPHGHPLQRGWRCLRQTLH